MAEPAEQGGTDQRETERSGGIRSQPEGYSQPGNLWAKRAVTEIKSEDKEGVRESL